MLPPTYHNNERFVRVCFPCQAIHERFVMALWAGDAESALALFSTGNINLHMPHLLLPSAEYPVHSAARGGNLALLKWLVENRFCSLFDGITCGALRTARNESVLGIAARYGHSEMMVYLTHMHGCRVSEITSLEVALTGLHSALLAPGSAQEAAGTTTNQLGLWLGGSEADSYIDDEGGLVAAEEGEGEIPFVPQQAHLVTGHPYTSRLPAANAHIRRVRPLDDPTLSPEAQRLYQLTSRRRPLVRGDIALSAGRNLGTLRAVSSKSTISYAEWKRRRGQGQQWALACTLVEEELQRSLDAASSAMGVVMFRGQKIAALYSMTMPYVPGDVTPFINVPARHK